MADFRFKIGQQGLGKSLKGHVNNGERSVLWRIGSHTYTYEHVVVCI